jgi:hypothetical protein
MSVGTLTRPLLGLIVSVLLIGAMAVVAPGTASAAGGGTVRGHVQDQSGVALNDICFSFVKEGRANGPNTTLISFAPSDLGGFFQQANIPAGKYIGYYSQCGPITTGSSNTEPVAVYTGNTLNIDAATKISVVDGGTVDLGTLQLAAGGDTSGTLLDARGGSAPNVSINAWGASSGLLLTQGCSDINGHYAVFNMPASGIKLEFAPAKGGGCGNDVAYVNQWFGGANFASAATIPITPGVGGNVATTTLADSSKGAKSLTSISFTGLGTGKAFAPTLTINGTKLGKMPPPPNPATPTSCGSPSSGYDYGTKLYFNDWTAGWQAGHIGDCIGFVVNSWSPTQIKLTLGDFYFDAQYGAIQTGDQYTMVVDGAVFTGTAS